MGFASNYQEDSIELSIEEGRLMQMHPLRILVSSFVPVLREKLDLSLLFLSTGLVFFKGLNEQGIQRRTRSKEKK